MFPLNPSASSSLPESGSKGACGPGDQLIREGHLAIRNHLRQIAGALRCEYWVHGTIETPGTHFEPSIQVVAYEAASQVSTKLEHALLEQARSGLVEEYLERELIKRNNLHQSDYYATFDLTPSPEWCFSAYLPLGPHQLLGAYYFGGEDESSNDAVLTVQKQFSILAETIKRELVSKA